MPSRRFLKSRIPFVVIVIFISFLIQLLYLQKTPYNLRDHDVLGPNETGHLGYILYVSKYHIIPNADEGYEYHQAPLYYIFAGLYHNAYVRFFGSNDNYQHLQFLSIIFYTSYLTVASLIFKTIFKEKKYYYLATILLCYWPSGIAHSVRIGSDSFSYLISALSILYLYRAYQNKKTVDVLWSAIFLALGVLSKSTLLSLFPCFVPVIIRYLHTKASRRKVVITICLAIICLGTFVSLSKNMAAHQRNGGAFWLIPTGGGGDDLRVGNKIENYLYFDLQKYLSFPYANTFLDESGRQYFWNQIIKSSVLGEFSFSGQLLSEISKLLSFSVLVTVLISLFFVLNFSRSQVRKFIILLVSIFSGLGSLVAFRVKFPFACDNDFRYTYHILIPFVCLTVYGLSRLPVNKPIIRTIVLLIISSLPLLSIIFFAIFYFTP